MRTASAHDVHALHYEPDSDLDCADSKLATPVPHNHNGAFGSPCCFVVLLWCMVHLYAWENRILCLKCIGGCRDRYPKLLIFSPLHHMPLAPPFHRRRQGLPAVHGQAMHAHLLRAGRVPSARFVDRFINFLFE